MTRKLRVWKDTEELSRPVKSLQGNLCAETEELKENFNGPRRDNLSTIPD
jgi:hypothetical protein